MNENNFSVDVQAEQQAFSGILTPSEIGMSDIKAAQVSMDLPESLPIRPTAIPIDVNAAPEISKTAIDLQVKFDAETSYKQLKGTVDELQNSMDEAARKQSYNWLPDPRASQKFEERPTTDPTNLIFDDRMDRFSSYPHWA